MENTNITSSTDTNTTTATETSEVISEEQRQRNNALIAKAKDYIKQLGLRWTIRSIEYLVNRENISLNQLRACVFDRGGNVVYDIERATKYIIMSGLISKQCDSDAYLSIEDRAYEVLEHWQEEFGYIGVLHMMLIEQMETKHFFMGTQDAQILAEIAVRKSLKSLEETQKAVDLQTKTSQSIATQL